MNDASDARQRDSLRSKSLLIALFPLVLAGLAAIAIWDAARRTAAAEDDVRAGIIVLAEIHALHASLAEAASGVRGYLMTGDPSFLAPYLRADRQLLTHFRELQSRVRDETQRELVTVIKALSAEKMSDLIALASLDPQHEEAIVETMTRNKTLLDRIRQQIEVMEAHEQTVIDKRARAAEQTRYRQLTLSLLAVILSVAAAVVVASRFSSDLIRRIRFLVENARRLEIGAAQAPVPDWRDELGDLGRRLEGAAALLTARAKEAQFARTDAERANQAKTEFLSRISHELRTPLNAILGFSRMLEEDLSDAGHRHTLKYVQQAGEHLLELVNDVLDLSRIEAGEFALALTSVGLSDLVHSAIRMNDAAAAIKSITVGVEPLPPDAIVQADARRLLQVLINLISNAIKFNRTGGTVVLRAWPELDGWWLEVADNGMGIAPESQARLFQPFERLGQTAIEGTGLGLALSRRLIQAMKGDIAFDSSVDQGSRFRIWLPVATGSRLEPDAPIAVTPSSTAPAATLSKGREVLLIEDQLSNRILVEALLARRRGWRVRSVETLGAANAAIAEAMPAAILLDLHLPDGHGLHWLADTQGTVENLPPVIVLSADVLAATRTAAEQAGAAAFIGKPLDANELYSTLERCTA